jgi:hypothetical protein
MGTRLHSSIQMMEHQCNKQHLIHLYHLEDDPEFLLMAIRQQKLEILNYVYFSQQQDSVTVNGRMIQDRHNSFCQMYSQLKPS